MKEKLRAIFRGPVVFHPVLFAAFPILFLYAYNISQTSASQVWLPLGISVGAGLATWGVLTLVLRSAAKAGLATAIFLGLFFSYGHLYEALEARGSFVPRHAYLLPTMLFAWGYCVYFIGRAGRDFRVTTRLLNVVAVAVIAINLVNIASYEIRLRGVEAEAPAVTTQHPPLAGELDLENLPDIYFIILDEYSHTDTYLDWYDYDNSEFIQGLEDRGFFFASGSKTRTPHTPQAVAQVLNMEYLTGGRYWDEQTRSFEDIPHREPEGGGSGWDEATYLRIGHSKVADFLKAQGYQYIAFGDWAAIDRWDTYLRESADSYFNYYEEAATPWISDFQETLWNTTMLRPFYYNLVGVTYETAFRRLTLYTLEHLKALPEVDCPKFVFAHLFCPHNPFVFGPEGEYIEPRNWNNMEDRRFYVGQSIFISREIEEVVDVLLRESDVAPIIILQSDHGILPFHPGIEIGGDEWAKILNAMYLPGMDYSEISQSISPVNTFRLIFNHYFGADYEMLPDD